MLSRLITTWTFSLMNLTRRSSPLVLEMSCLGCLGSFMIPWHFSWKTSACNLIASLRCSTSTAAIWNSKWSWFSEAERNGAGGLEPTQTVMAEPLPAQPSCSPTSQGQHRLCHTCLHFLPVVVNYCHHRQRKKENLNCNELNKSKPQLFQKQIPTWMLCSLQFFCFSGFESLH